MPYPDVEAALTGELSDLGYTVTWTPIDLKDRLPVLRIHRIGGADDKWEAVDYPNVSIQVFALRDSTNPRAAHDLTAILRDRMNALQGVTVPGGLIDVAENVSGPIEIPWQDPDISIVETIYRLTTRAAA